MSGEDLLWGALDEILADLSDRGDVGFWLRDDDAVAPSPSLDRLMSVAAGAGVPLALAVIPARAEDALARRLNAARGVTVLQHGYAHANHAAAGCRKCELGADRAVETVLAELREGRDRLAAFGAAQPMLVPPWNRIADALAARLPDLGFTALSLYGPRLSARDPAGLRRLNTHIDPVDWRGTRGFLGRERVLVMLVQRLRSIRDGEADACEPTGILTHHLVHDAETFAFLEELLKAIGKHSAARWLSVETLLRLKDQGEGAGAE